MKFAAIVLLVTTLAAPAVAQNSDIAVLVNVSKLEWDFGTRTQTEYRIGVQGSYARQILERRAGRLYFELPASLFAPPIGQGVITSAPSGNSEIARPESIIFVTPGIRYHYSVKPRLALYAAAGVGIAIRERDVLVIRPKPEPPGAVELLSIRTNWKGSPAFNLAGGIAFRLTRLLSLRGELRTFQTTSVPGYGSGRSYPSVHMGIGFHF